MLRVESTPMAQAKKRTSKKKASKRPAQGAAKRSQTNAALKRARDPQGVKRTLAAREGQRTRRLGAGGTAISPGAMRALDAEARNRGFRSGDQVLHLSGAKRAGTITTTAGRARTYAKAGRQG
jgi:hypothetical protein